MQSKKSTSKDKIRERQKNKSNRKRKTNSGWLCLILPGALPVSLNAKGNTVFP